MNVKQLYYDIAYCPKNNKFPECRKVINYYKDARGEEPRIAQPATGDISKAKVWYIGTNP